MENFVEIIEEKDDNKNVHEGHRKRMRDVVNKRGLDGMPQHQVLEYMLSFVVPQRDTNIIAHSLINKYGSISAVLEASQTSLADTKGVGEVVAHYLANFRNMFAYYQHMKADNVSTISNSREACEYAKYLLGDKLIEELYITGLDSKNQIIFTEKISTGTLNKNNVSIRTITELIVHYKVGNIIVAHNHPRGRTVPSPEDDRFTRALACAMEIIDVKVLDHIIVGTNEFYSYFTNDRFEEFKKEFASFVDSHAVAQNHAHYEA